METKLLLQDLADLMARHDGITKKKADAFVRAFFETIRQGLETDRYVKIKGFGTFKLVEVGERESVNISTGERFQISGHAKISFTPDAALKDLVNRPFAHFQTITLSEDVNLDELESVQVEEEVIPQVPLPAPEPAEEVPVQDEEVIEPAEEVPMQAEENPEPVGDVPAPTEEIPEPAEEVPEPAEEIPAPAEEVPVQAEENPEPVEENPVQDEEVPEPAEEIPEPAEEIPERAEEVPVQAEEVPVQAEEVPEPAEEVPVPAEEVIETAEPENPQVTACACNTPEESTLAINTLLFGFVLPQQEEVALLPQTYTEPSGPTATDLPWLPRTSGESAFGSCNFFSHCNAPEESSLAIKQSYLL